MGKSEVSCLILGSSRARDQRYLANYKVIHKSCQLYESLFIFSFEIQGVYFN